MDEGWALKVWIVLPTLFCRDGDQPQGEHGCEHPDDIAADGGEVPRHTLAGKNQAGGLPEGAHDAEEDAQRREERERGCASRYGIGSGRLKYDIRGRVRARVEAGD